MFPASTAKPDLCGVFAGPSPRGLDKLSTCLLFAAGRPKSDPFADGIRQRRQNSAVLLKNLAVLQQNGLDPLESLLNASLQVDDACVGICMASRRGRKRLQHAR